MNTCLYCETPIGTYVQWLARIYSPIPAQLIKQHNELTDYCYNCGEREKHTKKARQYHKKQFVYASRSNNV